jgi:hypothetical protein
MAVVTPAASAIAHSIADLVGNRIFMLTVLGDLRGSLFSAQFRLQTYSGGLQKRVTTQDSTHDSGHLYIGPEADVLYRWHIV